MTPEANEGIPKAIVKVMKVSSPARHRGGTQFSYASKSICGNCGASGRYETTREPKMTEELTCRLRVHDGKIKSETELRENQEAKCTTAQLVPPGHTVYPKRPSSLNMSSFQNPERMARP